ncbi:MAG: STAS domain-containing protein [Candidatus Acidiferrales bacterium]
MSIKIRQAANAVILDLEGVLKMGQGEQEFRDALQEVLDAGNKNLAVNLTGVTEVDSSGISALVHAHTSTKRKEGRCRFYGAAKRVSQVIKMVRLDTVFEMVEDEAAALAGL